MTQESLELTRQQLYDARKAASEQLQRSDRQAAQQQAATEQQLELTRESVNASQKYADAASRTASIATRASMFSERSFETSHRAYMVLDGFQLSSEPKLDNDPQVTLRYRNVGQTPALKINAAWRAFGVLYGARAEPLPRLEVPEPATESVGPNMTFSARFVTQLQPEWLDRISKREAVLAIVGVIVYQDIFGKVHATENCGMWSKGQISGGTELRMCAGGLLPSPRFE